MEEVGVESEFTSGEAVNQEPINFSENLSVPVTYEPQSLHWAQEQLSVHSGILKIKGNKSYHP